jgi:hypothetical protein
MCSGNIPPKQETLLIFVGNYARCSRLFESGFTGNIPQKQATPLIFVGNYVRSSQALGVNIKSKPVGEKTRGIASLHGTTDPNGMDDLMVGFYCFDNREIHLDHEKANAIRPYNNGII